MNQRLTSTGPFLECPPTVGVIPDALSILYVDDNELIREGIRAGLVYKGLNCRSASGGEAALQWLSESFEPVDFLITDHQMPGMDGLEFVRQVRAMNFAGKILVHSTMLTSQEVGEYGELNVDAIVPKTGNLEALFRTILALQSNQAINPSNHESKTMQSL